MVACHSKMSDPLRGPVLLDGIVSDEKLSDLLSLATEYAELDFKASIDLDDQRQLVEFVKDVAAMQVVGGYILLGVDPHGRPTGDLDWADLRVFDEARLAPKLRRWLPEPLRIVTRVAKRDDHQIVVVYVERHPGGLAFMEKDGTYMQDGQQKSLFRTGDVFWRDGTRSIRLGQQGLEEVIKGRITEAKSAWMDEQRAVRAREQMEYRAASESSGTLGSVNLDLEQTALGTAALELVRRNDGIALRYLLDEALGRARGLIDRQELEPQLGDLLDRLTCVSAVFLSYRQDRAFTDVIEVITRIYSMPLQDGDVQRFAYSTRIDPSELAPRVWLQIIERIYALGSLALRKENWRAVRLLTLQQPRKVDDFEKNWLRHAITAAARAQHFVEQKEGRSREVSLLMLARAVAARLDCLRPDGVGADDDELLTSLAEFDLLSNIVAIDGAGEPDGRYFYPNFARFEPRRVTPVVERLIRDRGMRDALFSRDDQELALALTAIGRLARHEGMRYFGFSGWSSDIDAFIAENTRLQTSS
jgi:hypothetical protein